MGKDSTKTKGRSQRHDPLHVQLAEMPENNSMKKAPRQKFVERNNRAEEAGEVKKKKKERETFSAMYSND